MKIKSENNLSLESKTSGKNKILIDSNILIDHIRGFCNINKILDFNKFDYFISLYTVLEIHCGMSMKHKKIYATSEELLHRFTEIKIDRELILEAGKISRENGISAPDALIAATAILNKCTLITRNIKHFQKIPKLKVLQPE